MSLGIQVEDDEFAIIVNKNTSLPTEKKQIFTTVFDYQEAIKCRVFQILGRRYYCLIII